MLLLHTLGRLQLVDSDAPEVPMFTGPKPLLLLAYLAIEGPASRRHLGELFFAGHADQLDNVSVTIRRLNRVDDSLIVTSGSEVHTTARCDYPELRQAILERVETRALDTYAGSFLKGCDLSVYGVEFEEWAYGHRTAAAEALRNLLIERAEVLCSSLRLDEAAGLAQRAYLLPGADEPDAELLMRLQAVLTAANHPLEAEVRSEARRFGVEERAESVHTKLNPGVSGSAGGNLPLPLRSFIGREPEIIELLAMLRRSDVSLVTLQGVGGAGKSQLALEVARQLADDARFQDGVFVVALDSVANHRQVPLATAN